MSSNDTGRDRLAATLSELAALAVVNLGLVVEDLTIMPAGKRRVVRISVDDDLGDLDPSDETSPVPAVSLDQVAEATKAISAVFDEREPMGSAPYVLEVSSPGVGRPLTDDRHYRRNVGRLLEIVGADGATLTGRLRAARPGEITLTRPATKTEPEHDDTLRCDQIARARVLVEFSRDDSVGDTPDDDLQED